MNKLTRILAVLGAGLCLSTAATAAVSPYSQDFESYNIADVNALGNDGWIVFGAIFDNGVFQYQYGPNPAPNDSASPAFSNIVTGENAPSSTQELSIFGDYQNLDLCDAGKLYESEANTFQEQTIAAGDIGKTMVFRLSYKLGNLISPSTNAAFIKTIDPATGFSTTNNLQVDTTGAPTTWTNDIEISLLLDATDVQNNSTGAQTPDGIPDLVGQLIQFGFVAANVECGVGSGVIYDNVSWFEGTAIDTDGDGVDDSTDNCTNVVNATQTDTDGDDIGNACDADYNNDCFVNFLDLNTMKGAFFTPDANVDLTGDGFVNFLDLNEMKNSFFQQPGPSAAGCN